MSLNAIIGENGIITNALDAKVLSQYSAYKEELETYLSEDLTCADEDMKKYMKSMNDEDIDKFIVWNGKLYFIGDNEYERRMAESVGIDTSLSGLNIDDLKALAGSILPLENEYEVPEFDYTEAPDELIGKRLYDKVPQNDINWDVVIDYDTEKNEIGRWGSGYYYLKSGNYVINGKEINLKSNYILDYNNNMFILLSDNYVDWNIDSTLAVKNGLVLNIDPTNFEKFIDENGTLDDDKLLTEARIEKKGNISCNLSKKSLVFTEDGYLELSKRGNDFSEGFTFELFSNLDNPDGSDKVEFVNDRLGFFSGGKSLDTAMGSLKFCYDTADGAVCRFWTGNNNNINAGKNLSSYNRGGSVCLIDTTNPGYCYNDDFYLTFVYTVYDEKKDDVYKEIHYDEYMIKEKLDKIEYYINGDLFGYTYYNNSIYSSGREYWDSEDAYMWIGVCPLGGVGNTYMPGNVYTLRVYRYPMSFKEVQENYTKTLLYIESF